MIPNEIDNFWFNNIYKGKRLRNDSKKIRVIYAGRVEKNKNIRTTQIALEVLRRKGIETSFVIVGKIVDKGYYLNIIKDEYTSYIEAQPKEKLIELYRNADIFAMPSHHETFGLVYAEAMSQGLPVIYTKGQGFDEQFPDGTVGYAVNDNNPHDIAKKIELTIANYEQISVECLRCVSKFRWDILASEYKKIYKRVNVEEYNY